MKGDEHFNCASFVTSGRGLYSNIPYSQIGALLQDKAKYGPGGIYDDAW